MTVWFRSERGHGRDAMPIRNNRLDEARTLYARMMAAASGSSDPRLERIFELVPREAFLPPGPWHIMVEHRLVETPSADPALLYQNALVVLDRQKGINNGEPFLHAGMDRRGGAERRRDGDPGRRRRRLLHGDPVDAGAAGRQGRRLRDRRSAGASGAAKPRAIRERYGRPRECGGRPTAAVRRHLRQCRGRCTAACSGWTR